MKRVRPLSLFAGIGKVCSGSCHKCGSVCRICVPATGRAWTQNVKYIIILMKFVLYDFYAEFTTYAGTQVCEPDLINLDYNA